MNQDTTMISNRFMYYYVYYFSSQLIYSVPYMRLHNHARTIVVTMLLVFVYYT